MPSGSGGGDFGGGGGGCDYGGSGEGYVGNYGGYGESVGGHGEGECKCTWCCALVIWAFVVPSTLAVVVILPLTLLPPFSNPTGSDVYASRDTAILSYSKDLCDGLHATSRFPAERIQATLYLLTEKPTSTRQELISFARIPWVIRQYRFWYFHLLPNSRVILTACTRMLYLSTVFYFIKGTSNFNKWAKNPSGNYENRIGVDESCSTSGNNNETFFQYNVESDDQYYMVFYNKASSSQLQLTFNITQVLYTVSSDIVADNCSVFYYRDSCSLPVPYSSHQLAFLQIEPIERSDIDWDANNIVRLSCHRRAWVYVLISFFSVVGIILLSVAVPLAIYVYRYREELKLKWCS